MIRLLGILVGAAIAVAALILLVGLPEFPDQSGQDAPPTSDLVATSGRDQSGLDEPPVLPVEPEQPESDELLPDVTDDTVLESNHWYAFWSPFRSELAANGFVSQLQRTTGLDYRVVKLKPGVYEVAFAYSDDADAETKLAQISAATGLNIPES